MTKLWGLFDDELYVAIKPTKYEHEKCNRFAELQIKTSFNYYNKINNSYSEEMRKLFIKNGKLAECAYSNYLNEQLNLFENPIEPDFTIYSTKYKSFDADLNANENKYHVKSAKYDLKPEWYSWGFSQFDPIIKNGNNIKENEFLAPAIINKYDDVIYCLKPIQINKIRKLLKPAKSNNPNMVKEGMYYIYANDLSELY